MAGWVEARLQEALSVSSEAQLCFFVQSAVASAGFTSWSYLARVRIPVTQPRNLFYSSGRETWCGGCEANVLWAQHPVFLRATRSRGPIVWSEAAPGEILEALDSMGLRRLRSGWAQGCWDATGACGVFAVARSEGALSEAEFQRSSAGLSWLAQVVHTGMMALDGRQRPTLEVDEPLTEREIEILRWTAEGKTSAEVSEILGIAERTVNFHITRSVEKLKVNNKLAATVRAAMIGLL
jgi:LuxR family transcriptional regulator